MGGHDKAMISGQERTAWMTLFGFDHRIFT